MGNIGKWNIKPIQRVLIVFSDSVVESLIQIICSDYICIDNGEHHLELIRHSTEPEEIEVDSANKQISGSQVRQSMVVDRQLSLGSWRHSQNST